MTETNSTYLIYGVSKGLGRAILQFLPGKGDQVFGVSRTPPDPLLQSFTWIQADLSRPGEAAGIIKSAIGAEKIDCLIYNTGIWETTGFTPGYDFEQVGDDEIEEIVRTNITSALLGVKSLLPNIKKSGNGKIIFIGSTLALPNHNKKEVVFSTAKFALQGMIHALRTHTREHNIGVTMLNIGDLATQYRFEEGVEVVTRNYKGILIPIADIIQALRFIINTSHASCVKEIVMPSMKDQDI